MKWLIIFFIISIGLGAQEKEIDGLIKRELKMTFPSIYFKHNSTDYATMPYTVDSCFKYIALNFDANINSLVIWRDSLEKEGLTTKRIKKLKEGLHKYIHAGKIDIHSMGKEQKISQRTINMTTDSTKIKYLLSLNSVFDFSKTRPLNITPSDSHGLWILGTCWKHIITEPFRHPGYFTNKRKREQCRMERRHEQVQEKQNKL